MTAPQARLHRALVGPEPLRRHLADRRGLRRIDCADDPDPAGAAASIGLYATGTSIVNVDQLDASAVDRLAAALARSDEPALVETDTLPARTEKRLSEQLGDRLTVRRLSVDHGNGALLAEIAERLDMQLDRPLSTWLAGRLGHDPGRCVGTLEALAAGGYHTPTRAQLELLAGTANADGLPWHLLDRTLAGQPVGDLAATVDPIPAIGYLAKRLTVAAVVADDPDIDDVDLAELVGTVTPSARSQARTLARRFGATTLHQLIGAVAVADVRAKRGHGRAAILAVTAHIAAATTTNAPSDRSA